MTRNEDMNRTEVINALIQKNKYKSYLEIGCQNDINFNSISVDFKIGVDPESGGTHRMTSDEFFDSVSMKKEFDIIFIDGLHHADQVYKDIINSLIVLNHRGIIVCHDMIPSSYEAQVVPRIQKYWNGDCWKAFIKLRCEIKDLEMRTIQTDCGLGIIRKGSQTLLKIKPEDITYENFVANQEEWLQAISVDQFKEIYL